MSRITNTAYNKETILYAYLSRLIPIVENYRDTLITCRYTRWKKKFFLKVERVARVVLAYEQKAG